SGTQGSDACEAAVPHVTLPPTGNVDRKERVNSNVMSSGRAMQIGIVGLGRMGGNIARRLMRHGHACVVWDRSQAAVETLRKEGAVAVTALDDLVQRLTKPRLIWLMLPAGDATEETFDSLRGQLQAGDVLIDGGNAFYRDDIRRAR